MDHKEETAAFIVPGAEEHYVETPQVRTFLAGTGITRHARASPESQRARKGAALVLGVLSVVLLATALYSGFKPLRWVIMAADVEAKKVLTVVDDELADMLHNALNRTRCAGEAESCKESKCCEWEGLQCYAKDDGWASCKPACVPGPDLSDMDDTHWSCKKLGPRTPGPIPKWKPPVADWVETNCSKPGERCTESKCCSQEGMQCYVKQHGWAACKASCIPGPDLQDVNDEPWGCERLGPRTPGVPMKPSGIVSDWVNGANSSCSGPNEDCRSAKCCKNPNVQCFEKNAGWATCKPYCVPGADKYDVDDEPWSCTPLGSKWTVTTTTTTTTRTRGSPSLFCVSVVRSFGPEPEIMEFQHEHQAGIFGCDETAVFCSDPLTVGKGHDQVAAVWFNPASVGLSKDGTAGNALLFMHVWDSLSRDGRWMKNDWTIKVDPDAIIIPDRLRDHLRPHIYENAFVRNCNMFPGDADYPMMFGALEALSKSALGTYLKNKAKCDAELDWTKLGEDLYLQRCLVYLGIMGFADTKIIGDNLCGGGANCHDAGLAAFHPFKTKEAWRGCWGSALGLW